MENPMRARIRERLDALGINEYEAATRAGFQRSYLYEFLTGKKDSIRIQNLEKIAKALDTTVEFLNGKAEAAIAGTSLPLSGICEHDAWRTSPAVPVGTVAVPPDARYPIGAQTAWLVRGDHFAPLGIPDGAIVIAVRGVKPRPGDYALVRRKDGQKTEISIAPADANLGKKDVVIGIITSALKIF